MPPDVDEADSTTLSPDDAFAALGNETRIQILQTLGQIDDPLGYSELLDRVEMRDSGQFNYHLGKLSGHFVRKTEDGYALRQAGRRVVQSVLSGAVTETPVLELTKIDEPCQVCGTPIAVSFHEERVEMYCTECPGLFGESMRTGGPVSQTDDGYLGYLPLPPAGVKGRTPREVFQAAWTWGNLLMLSMASGVCPRCSAAVDFSIDVCEAHDATDGLCDVCDRHWAASINLSCTNCIFDLDGALSLGLLANTNLLAFLTAHGLNPISPESITEIDRAQENYDEEIVAVDPFKARLTFTVNHETLSLTVDDDLKVVDVTESRTFGPA